MARYRITQNIIANGVPFEAGDEVDGDEVEGGCLPNMLRLGQAVEVTAEAAPDPESVEAAAKPPAIADAKPPAIQAAPKAAAKK